MALASSTHDMLRIVAQAADEKGGEHLVALDVSERFPFGDVFFIATGEVERNVQAISDHIEDELLEAGYKTLRREGREEGRWVLLDFGDIVVHVFHREERDFYEIERLWKDCPTIDLSVFTSGLHDEVEVR